MDIRDIFLTVFFIIFIIIAMRDFMKSIRKSDAETARERRDWINSLQNNNPNK